MNFTIYSKEGCPYCTKIEKVLKLAKLDYTVYKLDNHFTKEQFYQEFGQGSTFPQVISGAKNLGGCTDTIKYLQEQKII
jgi:glutaredoxin